MAVYDEIRTERECHADKGYDTEHDRQHSIAHILTHAKNYIPSGQQVWRVPQLRDMGRNDLVKAASMLVAAIELIDEKAEPANADQWLGDSVEVVDTAPTPEAYEAACKALWKHRERADKAEVAREAAEQAVQRVRELAKTSHRANCGSEFTVGYCRGCDLLRVLDSAP